MSMVTHLVDHQNPIWIYEFHGGEITELTANIIIELMYAQCDVDGNKYLWLQVFANHRKNSSVLSEEDQKVVVRW